MFRLTSEGKAYVCMQEGLIQGWKEADSIAELCSYQADFDKAPAARAGLQWLGAPVPAAVVGDALALIKHYKSFEIMVALFYNPETSDWVARIPNQKGSGAHVSYDESEDLNVPEGYYFQGTIHSHPNMAAFWSGTDTKDQGSKAGVHLVIGTNSEGVKTSSKGSLFYAGKQYDAEYAFEFPESVPTVREDWVELIEDMRKRKVFVQPPQVTYYSPALAGSRYAGSACGAIGYTIWDDCDQVPGACRYSMAHPTANTWSTPDVDDDDLSTLVVDTERCYCDNAMALGMLMSFIMSSSMPRDKREELIDRLDCVFAQAQLEVEPTFPEDVVFELAVKVANVVCPELAPDIAEALDPAQSTDCDDYYETYDATVEAKEAAYV